MNRFLVAAVLVLAAAPAVRAQDVSPVDTSVRLDLKPDLYKPGEIFPLELVHGADFLEPFLPVAAIERGDVGRIVLGSAMPYALLITAFAAENTDQSTLREITRWK